MGCIVVFDDDAGFCMPFRNDPDCEGALCTGGGEPVVMFDNRKDAVKAIRISKKFAELQLAQGKPHNSDFIEGAKFVCIVDVRAWVNPKQ